MSRRNEAVRTFRDIDDIIHIFTGKRLSQHFRRIAELVEEDIKRALMSEPTIAPNGSPYAVLHCRPDAADVVVKYRFRSLVKELHPDSGTHPDLQEYQRVVEAYAEIVKERTKRSNV